MSKQLKKLKEKKDLIIKCDCIGKCSLLRVIDYRDKDCEIQVAGNQMYLKKKSIEKLINYLNKIII